MSDSSSTASSGSAHWWRRSAAVVGLVSVAVLASMLTMQPAQAFDPIDPFNIPRSDPSKVVQFPKSAAWDPLEADARLAVAQSHGLQGNDPRLKYWAKEEIRSAMFARLLKIAEKGPSGDDAQKATEAAALARLQELFNALKVKTAQRAVQWYDKWKNSPCTFVPPAPFTFDDNDSLCATPIGSWFTSPRPPSVVEFQAYAAAEVTAETLGSIDAQRVMKQMALGLGFLTTFAASTALAGILLATVPEIAGTVASAVFPYTLKASWAFGVLGQSLGSSVPAAGGAFVSAAAVATVVTVAIIFIAVTTTAIVNLVQDLEVPKQLAQNLTDAQDSPEAIGDILRKQPADDKEKLEREANLMSIYTVFVLETLPDYYGESILGKQPVDAHVGGIDPVWTLDDTEKTSTMTVRAWVDPDKPELGWRWEEVYIHDGWFVRKPFGEPAFYSLNLPFFDWGNVAKIAYLYQGNSFFVRELNNADGLKGIQTNCRGNTGCNQVERLQLQLQNAGTLQPQNRTARFNDRPVIDLFFLQRPVEATDYVPTGAVTDPNGDPMTATWQVFNPDARGGGLYREYQGVAPTMRFPQDGVYPVKVTAVDDGGMVRSATGSLNVANASPTITGLVVVPKEQGLTSIDEGKSVTVSGRVSDRGPDPIDVTIDWGDGTSTEKVTFPCVAIPDDPCAQADDMPFTFSHTYADDKPGFNDDPWYFTVTATDPDGGLEGRTEAVFVRNIAPSVRLNTLSTGSPLQIPRGDVRVVPEGGTVELSAIIDDPGADKGSYIVDWGDGKTGVYAYPCTGADGCVSQDVVVSCGPLPPDSCPGTRVKVTHVYTGAKGGTEFPITAKAFDDDGAFSAPVTATAYIRADSQSLAFDPLPDVPVTTGSVALTATAQSGLAVVFTGSGACTVSGAVAVLNAAGTCSVTASQAGTPAWPAASVTRTFNVTTPLAVLAPSRSVVVGEPVGALTPTVTGFVNGDDAGDLTTPPTCTSPVTATTPPGTYPVTCSGGAGPAYYTFDAYTPGSVTVSKASTTTTVSIKAGVVTAKVAVAAPGSGAPSGSLTFRRGTTLLGTFPVGVAGATSLPDPMPAGPVAVSAEYSGDGSFTGSSGSTARQDPTLRADVVPSAGSAGRPNAAGWYRVRPEVRFTCAAGSSPLTAPCPAPVPVSDGRGQAVTRSVSAEDGGAATAGVTGLNVDTVPPALRVAGVANGARYSGQPNAVSCRAVDTLSGAAGCTVTRTLLRAARAPSYEAVWRFSAVGSDVAGNRTSATGTYTVRAVYLVGASVQRNGTTRVSAGQFYVLQTPVGGSRAPRLLYQVPAGARFATPPGPAGPLLSRNPQGLWEAAVRLPARAGKTARFWNVGVQDRASGRVYVVTMDLGPRR